MRFFFAILFNFFAIGLFAQGIEFFHGTWEEALDEAKKQEKLIFVDAYASWCGPCKRMAKNTFPDQQVGEFFNKNFINVKLDYEKPEAASFRKKYPVAAFPTLYFIDFDGSVVQAVKGAQQPDGLIEIGKNALKKVDRSAGFEEAYEKGDRSPELVYNYIKALNQANKSSLKIANDYLKEQSDLTTDINLKIIFEGASETDSKVFEMLISNRAAIEKIFTKEIVDERIHAACRRTAQKAAEFKVGALLDEAKDKMKAHYAEKADQFSIESDMAFYKATGQPDDYLKACRQYAKKIADKDATLLRQLAREMKNAYPLDPKIMQEAERIDAKAMRMKGA
ncbi:MAG TPA: thioredoxin family protein [Saprospiraceae bacterium]|nr:thioredoxin family protein [Saprospiraceae bacterium]